MAILGGLALVAGRMAATAPVPARSARCSSPASSCPARPPAGGAAPAERSAGRAIAGGAGALGAPQMDALGASLGWRWRPAPRRGCLPAGWPAPGARRWLGLATAGPAGPAAGRRPVPVGAVRPLDGDWDRPAICRGWCPGCCLFCARLAPARSAADGCRPHARLGIHAYFLVADLPSLTRPLLTAPAVGFSAEIAQYLPTLWLAGRIPTLTSGGAQQRRRGADARRSGAVAITAAGGMLYPDGSAGLLAGRYRRGLR